MEESFGPVQEMVAFSSKFWRIVTALWGHGQDDNEGRGGVGWSAQVGPGSGGTQPEGIGNALPLDSKW